LRRAGDGKAAKLREAEAEAIMASPKNHQPSRLSLVSKRSDASDIIKLNTGFVKWDVMGDSTFEHPRATVEL